MTRQHALIALGGLFVLVGGIWTAQGLGFLPGSVMTGVTLWAIVGPFVALYGIYLIVRALRERRRAERP